MTASRIFCSDLALAALVLLATAVAAAAPSLAPPLPGPFSPSHGARDAVAENARCEGCHAIIAEEWRRSLHRHAYDDPVFRSALALEPQPFCRGCHAPEADPTSVQPALRSLGVGCVSCHLQNGEVIGVRALAGSREGHPVRADARLKTPDACAGCHQFGFPLRPSAPMQDTHAEHAASRFASAPCQDCHMPLVMGPEKKQHRSHDFTVLGDPALLRSAVVARAARTSAQAITVTLEAGRVGHAFPTGDMFRRLEVRAAVLDEQGKPAGRASSVVLERRFEVHHNELGTDRVPTSDSRVPASGRAIRALLVFGEDTTQRRVQWQIAYQRMPPSLAALFDVEMSKDETIVAQGILDP